MIKIFLFLVFLTISFFIVTELQSNQSNIIINFQDYHIETSLFLIGLVLLLYSWVLVSLTSIVVYLKHLPHNKILEHKYNKQITEINNFEQLVYEILLEDFDKALKTARKLENKNTQAVVEAYHHPELKKLLKIADSETLRPAILRKLIEIKISEHKPHEAIAYLEELKAIGVKAKWMDQIDLTNELKIEQEKT